MGQDIDVLGLGAGTLWIDGQEIGKINNVNIDNLEVTSDEIKDISFDFNKSFEGSFKLKRESSRKLVQWIHLNLENARLIRILNKVKKLRAKKKLAGRINRNIYKLIDLGF